MRYFRYLAWRGVKCRALLTVASNLVFHRKPSAFFSDGATHGAVLHSRKLTMFGDYFADLISFLSPHDSCWNTFARFFTLRASFRESDISWVWKHVASRVSHVQWLRTFCNRLRHDDQTCSKSARRWHREGEDQMVRLISWQLIAEAGLWLTSKLEKYCTRKIYEVLRCPLSCERSPNLFILLLDK